MTRTITNKFKPIIKSGHITDEDVWRLNRLYFLIFRYDIDNKLFIVPDSFDTCQFLSIVYKNKVLFLKYRDVKNEDNSISIAFHSLKDITKDERLKPFLMNLTRFLDEIRNVQSLISSKMLSDLRDDFKELSFKKWPKQED